MHTLVGLSTKQNMTDQMEDGAHCSEGTLSMGSQDDHGWSGKKAASSSPSLTATPASSLFPPHPRSVPLSRIFPPTASSSVTLPYPALNALSSPTSSKSLSSYSKTKNVCFTQLLWSWLVSKSEPGGFPVSRVRVRTCTDGHTGQEDASVTSSFLLKSLGGRPSVLLTHFFN